MGMTASDYMSALIALSMMLLCLASLTEDRALAWVAIVAAGLSLTICLVWALGREPRANDPTMGQQMPHYEVQPIEMRD